MTTVAVVAHQRKHLGGGLGELRSALAAEGVVEPLWFEVPKSKKAPARAREALEQGADLVFVWGGDGMVQCCIDALAGTGTTVAIVPAGTANLLATNLGIPQDIGAAVSIGLHGQRRRLDVGVVNGERFAVMAGAGFDAHLIGRADAGLKDRIGRAAYVLTSLQAMRAPKIGMRIDVDGDRWFEGEAGMVLVGNVGTVMGGLEVFPHARPDDGLLEVGVVTAGGLRQWIGVIGHTLRHQADGSSLVHMTVGHEVDVRLDAKTAYELDGGARAKVTRLRIEIEPAAIAICVPAEGDQ